MTNWIWLFDHILQQFLANTKNNLKCKQKICLTKKDLGICCGLNIKHRKLNFTEKTELYFRALLAILSIHTILFHTQFLSMFNYNYSATTSSILRNQHMFKTFEIDRELMCPENFMAAFLEYWYHNIMLLWKIWCYSSERVTVNRSPQAVGLISKRPEAGTNKKVQHTQNIFLSSC